MASNFEELVLKEVRSNVNTVEWDMLRSDYDEWLIVLNSLKRDVELQLTAQKARISQHSKEKNLSKEEYNTFKSQEDQWRLKSLRFMISVEKKIMQVKKMRKDDSFN